MVCDYGGAWLGFGFERLGEFQIVGRSSAGNTRFKFPPRKGTAANIIEQLAHRDFADLVFVVARLLHMTGNTENARAGVVGRPDLRVRFATHIDDVLYVTQGLDVVHNRRALIETEYCRKIRRLDSRIRTLAFERFDQSRFLAANVSSRAAMDVDFATIGGAANACSHAIMLTCFFD